MYFQLENMAFCKCLREGERELYICKDARCPNNENQMFYCVKCAEKPDNHEHKPITIKSESELIHQKWISIFNDLYSTMQAAEAFYKNYKNVLLYLDHMINEHQLSSDEQIYMSSDFEELKGLYIKADKIFSEVRKAFLTCNIRSLIKLTSDYFCELNDNIMKFSYFNKVSNKHIYKNYKEVLCLPHT